MDPDKKFLIFPNLSASFSGKYEPETKELTAESSVDICLDNSFVIKGTDIHTAVEDERSQQRNNGTLGPGAGTSYRPLLMIYWGRGPQDFADDKRDMKTHLKIKLMIQRKNSSNRKIVQISGEFLQDLFYICNSQIFPSLVIDIGGKSMLVTSSASMKIKFSSGSSGEFQPDSPHEKDDFECKLYWENVARVKKEDRVKYRPFISSIKENNLMAASIDLEIQYVLPLPEEVFAENKNCLMMKILNDKLHTSVEILALDGGISPCHKSILAAASPVLASLLQSPMVETKTNQIHFDMEESSVAAFLEYLYTVGIHKPAQDSKIAVDLLEAGHKYDIPGMEKCMKGILLNRPPLWFEVDAAFKMFMFGRNVDSYEQVTTKAVQVLKFHREKLGTSEEFKDVLKRSPEASAVAIAELINAMFAL